MTRAYKSPLRPLAVFFAIAMVVFSFGMVGTAAAKTSSGGNDSTSSADSSTNTTTEKKNDSTSTTSTTSTSDDKKSARERSSTANGGKSTASDHSTKGNSGTSGTVTEPQPVSGADDNPGGANGQCSGGVYCSTRDGSPSGNGNGGGKATGKPCAGCVGKADNKNPKGQMPGPQDGNNGYECDGNNGIAKTNPAHTGCVPGTTPGGECVPGPGEVVDENGNCVPTDEECVPGPGEIMNDEGECVPVCPTDETIPMDDEDCNPSTGPEEGPGSNRPPTVAGVEQFAGPPPVAGVEQFAGPSAAGPSAVGPSGILPSTGATTLMSALAATGFGLLLLGAALLLRRKAYQA